MSDFRDIPIPPMMAHLERDARGYPIPVTVLRGNDGKPHFAINDTSKRQEILRENRCPICGKHLNAGFWFVGGPRSAFDPNGAYIDPPIHHQCMRYALQVCPYLAAPNYSKRVDLGTLDRKKSPALLFIDNTMLPDRPALFVGLLARRRQLIRGGEYVTPGRPYVKVEFWQQGKQLDPAEGFRLCSEVIVTPIPKLRAPRILRLR